MFCVHGTQSIINLAIHECDCTCILYQFYLASLYICCRYAQFILQKIKIVLYFYKGIIYQSHPCLEHSVPVLSHIHVLFKITRPSFFLVVFSFYEPKKLLKIHWLFHTLILLERTVILCHRNILISDLISLLVFCPRPRQALSLTCQKLYL